LIRDKKAGITPKPAFIAKIRQFQKLTESAETLEKEKNQLENLLQKVKTKLLTYQDMVIHATIHNRGAWKDYTHVAYHLLYPEMVLEFTPVVGRSNQVIYLEAIEDEGYEIAVKEAVAEDEA